MYMHNKYNYKFYIKCFSYTLKIRTLALGHNFELMPDTYEGMDIMHRNRSLTSCIRICHFHYPLYTDGNV